MLYATTLGTIISAIIGLIVVSVFFASDEVNKKLFRFLNSFGGRDWESTFNGLIRREQMRLGSLFQGKGKKKTQPNFKKNGAESLFEGLDPHDRESLNIIEKWFQCDKGVIEHVSQILTRDGKINAKKLPLKMYVKEVILAKGYTNLKGEKIKDFITTQVYIKAIKKELVLNSNFEDFLKLNEDVDIQKGIILALLLKAGGSEKACREQISKGVTFSLKQIKSFSFSKVEGIERQLASQHNNVKSLFNYFRNEARLQKKFEQEHAHQKQEKKKEQKNKKGHKSKKQYSQRNQTHSGQLNPQVYKDALAIMEMSKIVDLNSLKKRYRSMAMKHHPDKLKGADSDQQKQAHEKFVQINGAFQTLSKKCS